MMRPKFAGVLLPSLPLIALHGYALFPLLDLERQMFMSVPIFSVNTGGDCPQSSTLVILIVHIKVAAVTEGLPALVALEGLHACVNAEMLHQRAAVVETLGA